MTEFTIRDAGLMLLKLWQNKWIIAFITLSGLLAGMAFTAGTENTVRYSATSSVCVTYTTYQEQMRGSSVITSYSGLVGSLLVCERAAEILDGTGLSASGIQKMVTNSVCNNSYVMYITAEAENPQLAIRVTNAVAQAFTDKVSSVSGNNSLQLLDTAHTAETIGESSATTILTAAAVPLVVACAFIIVKETIGGKIRLLSQCINDPEELIGILPDTSQRWS